MKTAWATWQRMRMVDGSSGWQRPGTRHDAMTIHADGDDSEFGIVVAVDSRTAIRIDEGTFAGAAAAGNAARPNRLAAWRTARNQLIRTLFIATGYDCVQQRVIAAALWNLDGAASGTLSAQAPHSPPRPSFPPAGEPR